MAQERCVSRVVFLSQTARVKECVGGNGRKAGNTPQCAKCGVNKPIPIAKWLEKLSWASGARFLSEQAEALKRALQVCVSQGWVEQTSPKDASNRFFDQLNLAVLSFVENGNLTQSAGDRLLKSFRRVAARKDFFATYAYRGILQNEILDCARCFSIELWRDGARSDITLRPGGEYYAYLHSLSRWVYETKKRITLRDLCQAVDTEYPAFPVPEKRLVFGFCLMREFVSRLNRHNGKSLGITISHQELILNFIRRLASSD